MLRKKTHFEQHTASPHNGETTSRWNRMKKEALTLEKISELHSAAYRAENKSDRTVSWHQLCLASFTSWLQETAACAPIVQEFTLEHVRQWAANLREQPRYANHPHMPEHVRSDTLSPETVSWYVRGLRAISTWMYEEGYTSDNVLKRLKAPKVPDKEIDILSNQEIEDILRLFHIHTEIGSRDLAIFTTLLDTGIRAGELCDLRLQDLHLDQGYMIVMGKGRKERPVKVGHRTIKAIRFYMAHWRQPARPTIQNVFLTIGHQMGAIEELWCGSGEPLTVNALQRILRRVGKRSNVTRLHPHLLRHTFACMYLMQYHDPFALKNLLGHTSLTMTYRYVRTVERLMVIQGTGASILDSMELPPMKNHTPNKKKR